MSQFFSTNQSQKSLRIDYFRTAHSTTGFQAKVQTVMEALNKTEMSLHEVKKLFLTSTPSGKVFSDHKSVKILHTKAR